MVLTGVTVVADGTLWTVSGNVSGVPVSIPIDLNELASRLGHVPTMNDLTNHLVGRLRQEYVRFQVEQMAANPPANVPDIVF